MTDRALHIFLPAMNRSNVDSHEDPNLDLGDLRFLIATFAREESSLGEIVSSLGVWEFEKGDAIAVLEQFLELRQIVVFEENDGQPRDMDTDMSRSTLVRLFDRSQNWLQPQLGLTELGWKRYENDDFGISERRARFLLFSDRANKSGR